MNINDSNSSSAKCSIFLFPHQDDEFGVYHALSHELRKGRDVWCIYFTDGGSKAERRNQESLRALKRLGVDPQKILFQGQKLGVEDGTLVYHLSLVTSWFLPFVQSLGDIDRIYVSAWEGGHPDHDALHAVAVFVSNYLDKLYSVRQFSLYNAYQRRAPFFCVMTPLMENGIVEQQKISRFDRLKYIRMCLGYPSQAKTWLGLFPFVTYSYLFIGRQSLQKVNYERLNNRPHEGLLYYESRGFETWKNMQSLISEYLLKA